MSEDKVYYSREYRGATVNWNLPAKFDWSDGCLGITQDGRKQGKGLERVLLSPAQGAALLRFVAARQGAK